MKYWFAFKNLIDIVERVAINNNVFWHPLFVGYKMAPAHLSRKLIIKHFN